MISENHLALARHLAGRLYGSSPMAASVDEQAKLVITACLALMASIVFLLIVWKISGDLEKQTVAGAVLFLLVLMGIGALAQAGQLKLAVWGLVCLLVGLITADILLYNVASLAVVGYVLPILIAALSSGLWAGLGTAGICSLMVWASAWGQYAGWYSAKEAAQRFHVTFIAPLLTAIFITTALMAGI